VTGVLDRILWLTNHKPVFDAVGVDLLSHDHFSPILEEFFNVVWAVEDKEACVILAIEHNNSAWKKNRDRPLHFPGLDLSRLYKMEDNVK